MKKITKSAWPVLLISDQIDQHNDTGEWLRRIIRILKEEQDCSVLFSYNYSDAHDLIYSREDLGVIVIDWDMKDVGRLHHKNSPYLAMYNESSANRIGNALIAFTRERNSYIPIVILSDRGSIEEIPDSVLSRINGVMWKLTDTPQFLSGRIEKHLIDYAVEVLPQFFEELIRYVNEYKYAWHTPGHMGGAGFLKSPCGTAFHKFFGEDVLRADLSISVPELGSLLDHSGITGEAEQFSAKVFGAHRTYYVLNGTSTANQIIWRSQVSPGERALVDRNCHKSLNYAMVITSAHPEYMKPMRNGMGIIGPVDFSGLDTGKPCKMAALTNSTYDGVCYNTRYVRDHLGCAENIHFDEAWYAYAKFHPLYKDHFGMSLPMGDKLIFCSQSTHKLLTAFSQASMIHIRFTNRIENNEDEKELFHSRFNESYMMHGSTSPQYNMVASLEVATKMMHDNGETAWGDIIEEAIELRKKIASSRKNNTLVFGIWQPDHILDIPAGDLIKNQEHWLIKPGESWHGFDLEETYVMLDPIKLTFTCPGIDVNGNYADTGIPAAIVTNYLMTKGIVCEKSDYYSWLLLNSLGTTKGKQGSLLAELFKFQKLYDTNHPLEEVFPALVSKYPENYRGTGLKDHCHAMHNAIKAKNPLYKKDLLGLMHDAFEHPPETFELSPGDAYRNVVNNNVEFIELRSINKEKKDRIAAVMLVPYPPGIPVLMGGEKLIHDSPILNYLLAREDFEQSFPGYESDIHGIERTGPDADGKSHFKTLVIKNS